MLEEKWASRCGWLGTEWDEWFDKAVKEREEGREFWERAQERVVRERSVSVVGEEDNGMGKGVAKDEVKLDGKKVEKNGVKRKSVFKRLFKVGGGGK